MEMVMIALIAVIAFALVLLPLFRRKGGTVDDSREFEPGPRDTPVREPVPPLAAGPATPIAPDGDTTLERDVEGDDGMSAAPGGNGAPAADEVEQEVLRYREALRAGTLCGRCGQANPPGSGFCFDCGKRLPLAEAREFE